MLNDVNSLNSGVVIFSISPIFVLQSVFFTKLLTLGILFLTAARAVVVVAKLVILGILPLTSFILMLRAAVVVELVMLGICPLTSFILALRVVLIAKLVISGILHSIFLVLALYTSFLTTTFFTTSLKNWY